MNIIEQAIRHKSIRNFTSESVAEGVLEKIFEVATRASTGGSMQLYSMIVTTDAKERELLSALHLGSEAVKQAPVVITFCVDTHRLSRFVELHGETPGFDNMWGFAIGFSDALLAAQNALLAAESEGLGGCFLGSTFVSAHVLSRVFQCPRGVVPVATLVLGHPAEDPAPGTRLPVRAVVHRGRYTEPPAAELDAMYAEHARATFERFCEVPYVGHAVKAAGIEHLAGYYAKLMYPGELIETAGAYFMAAIESQGFSGDAELARIRAVRSACESEEIAALHPIRQLAFSMALVSGHADHVLSLRSGACEQEISSFLTARDPAILDDLVQRGVFDVPVRARFCALLAEFGAGAHQHAAAAE